MSPKKKDAKFQPVRVTQELFDETKLCADQADEYMADYIRKAVEQRNARYKRQPYSNMSVLEMKPENIQASFDKVTAQQENPKHKPKPDATGKPQMVQSKQ